MFVVEVQSVVLYVIDGSKKQSHLQRTDTFGGHAWLLANDHSSFTSHWKCISRFKCFFGRVPN